MNTLDDFLKHNDPFVVELAAKLKEYQAQLAAGTLDKANYQLLTQQLLDVQGTFKAATSEQHRQELAVAVSELIALARMAL